MIKRSYILLNVLVEVYSRVLRRSDQLSDSSTAATILEFFSNRLQLDKLKEGVEMSMIDLHAFVGGVKWFAHVENEEYSATFPSPEHLSVIAMMQMQPGPRRLKLAPPLVGMQA